MKCLRNSSACVVLLILVFTSCKDSHEYSVDSAFTAYLQRFEDEAATRGRTFDPKSSGLIIEFGDLSGDVAGLTHYEKPVRIQIDKTYWDAISNNAGADLMKEDLLFHELGHGLLGRQHLNTTLENGDWKSIMCGGNKVNDRAWNINYRGERRKYYLDELFNESTKAPDFSSLEMTIDTTGYSTLVQRSFETQDQAIWPLVDDSKHKISLDNGRLCFQSKASDSYLVTADISKVVTISPNFSYEITIQYPTGANADQYGMAFAPKGTDPRSTAEYMTINNNQRMFMGSRYWYSFFTELPVSAIIKAGANKLKVFKVGEVLYYFINGLFCYRSEIVASADLNQFGFIVPPMGTVWVDNFRIATQTSAGVAQKVKQNIQIVGEVQTISDFNLNTINKQ